MYIRNLSLDVSLDELNHQTEMKVQEIELYIIIYIYI